MSAGDFFGAPGFGGPPTLHSQSAVGFLYRAHPYRVRSMLEFNESTKMVAAFSPHPQTAGIAPGPSRIKNCLPTPNGCGHGHRWTQIRRATTRNTHSATAGPETTSNSSSDRPAGPWAACGIRKAEPLLPRGFARFVACRSRPGSSNHRDRTFTRMRPENSMLGAVLRMKRHRHQLAAAFPGPAPPGRRGKTRLELQENFRCSPVAKPALTGIPAFLEPDYKRLKTLEKPAVDRLR